MVSSEEKGSQERPMEYEEYSRPVERQFEEQSQDQYQPDFRNEHMLNNRQNDLHEVFNDIDYTYIDKSIKQRRWLNRSVMRKRDNQRLEDHKRREAQNSIKREFKEMEEVRSHNKIHTNKKSKKLAQAALKKKIKAVVNTYAQNGYLAFEHFLHVLYMLQITQNIGRLEEDLPHNERIRRVKDEKDAIELEFALQFWNKIN